MKLHYRLTMIILMILPSIFSVAQTNCDTLTIPSIGLSSAQLRMKTAMCTNDNSKIWIGTRSSGIVYFDGNGWTLIDKVNTSLQLPSDSITALHYDKFRQQVWIGTNQGLTAISSNGNFTSYAFNSIGFSSSEIRCIISNSTTVFVGTNSGISILDVSSGNWAPLNSTNSSLQNDTINSLFIDSNGLLWIATNGGYASYDGQSIISISKNNSNLQSNSVREIIVTPFDTIIVLQNSNLVRRSENKHLKIDSLYIPSFETDFCDSATPFTLQIPDSVNWSGFQISNIEMDKNYNIFFSRNFDFNQQLTYISTDRKLFYLPLDAQLNFSSSIGKPIAKIYQQDSVVICFVGLGLSQNNLCIMPGLTIPGYETIPEFDLRRLGKEIPVSFKGGAQIDLTGNMVKARILNRGDLHWDPINQIPFYEVPIKSNKNSVFASSIWLGGFDSGGLLHCAAQTYRQGGGNDFWPGPLNTSGFSTTTSKQDFDHIWVARKSDIDEFRYQYSIGNVQNGTYTVPSFILDWPAYYNDPSYPQRLAPFVDINNDNQYRPLQDGDYPEIKGDQMAWCVFNDYGIKTETTSDIMGIEIHLSAYSFNCIDSSRLAGALSYTTFYHYDLYNRGVKSFDSLYFGIWSDFDLGNAADDYMGCNLPSNSFFVYNGDADDDGGGAYGSCPPRQNVVFLDSPEAPLNDGLDNNHDGVTDEPGEEVGLSRFMYYENTFDPINGNPTALDDYYQYLSGSWMNGSTLTYGGNGRGTGPGATNIPCQFMFPGTSDSSFSTTWTMGTAGYQPTDMRGVGSVGPISLPAGAMKSFDVAFVTGSNDSTLNNKMVQNLRNFFHTNDPVEYASVAPPIQGPATVNGIFSFAFYSLPPLNNPGNTYNWTISRGSVISGQGTNSILVKWDSIGKCNVNVEVTRPGFLCKLTRDLSVNVGINGIDEMSKNQLLTIYPNPASHSIQLRTPLNAYQLKVYSIQGQLLYSSSYKQELDVSSLNPGVYILVLSDKNNRTLHRDRFVKN